MLPVPALFAGFVPLAVALTFFEIEDRCHIGRVADAPFRGARPRGRGLIANRPALIPDFYCKFRMLSEPVFDGRLCSGSQIPSARCLDLLHNWARRLPRTATQQQSQNNERKKTLPHSYIIDRPGSPVHPLCARQM